MPVLVFKAIQGFADRLQMLSHCIAYCKQNNTNLCVDWEDHVWGGLEFDFYRLFSIEGVKTMRKYKVKEILDKKQPNIQPPCWTPKKIIQHISLGEIDPMFQGTFQHSFDKVPGDVLVTNGEGMRTFNTKVLCEHLRFKPEIVEQIRQRLKNFDPKCLLIHLRGTDRKITDKDLEKAIETFNVEGKKKYVVTDEKELWEKFKAKIPDAELVNPNPALFRLPPSPHGTHQHNPDLLKEYGISKWEMVMDLLTDFCAIMLAEHAGGRLESTFFFMARGLRGEGVEMYSKLFNGKLPIDL